MEDGRKPATRKIQRHNEDRYTSLHPFTQELPSYDCEGSKLFRALRIGGDETTKRPDLEAETHRAHDDISTTLGSRVRYKVASKSDPRRDTCAIICQGYHDLLRTD